MSLIVRQKLPCQQLYRLNSLSTGSILALVKPSPDAPPWWMTRELGICSELCAFTVQHPTVFSPVLKSGGFCFHYKEPSPRHSPVMQGGTISVSVHGLRTAREKRWKQVTGKQASIKPKLLFDQKKTQNICSFGTTWKKSNVEGCGRNFSVPLTLFWSQRFCSDGIVGNCFQVSRFRGIQGSTFTF